MDVIPILEKLKKFFKSLKDRILSLIKFEEDKMINLNELAREITLKEAGETEVSIAQVKEIMKLVFEKLAELEPLELFQILKKYQ